MQYKTIDLCAGIGGIRRGFELAGGFSNVLSAENDVHACRTYECLFHENPYNDVTTEEFKDKAAKLQYDVLLAGFPCQTFSSVGLQKGFEDDKKGSIFFEIETIIRKTIPKAVFLENVQNLIAHKKGETFRIILDALDRLGYKIIGADHDETGRLCYDTKSFVRNSKDFGMPQNRPRVFIIAFSKDYFGNHLSLLPESIPAGSTSTIYESVNDVLERDVPAKYFLSEGYLETLENHIVRQKEKGYGFGYRIVNTSGTDKPIASTLLATGGSGKERNLIFDSVNGNKHAGVSVKGKFSVINEKCIRVMTPTEWGRLQGFIGYGFVDSDGTDRFKFPDGLPDAQKYKQFGNSVTIPVIAQMAIFIREQMEIMEKSLTQAEILLYGMYGIEFRICKRINDALGDSLRTKSLSGIFAAVKYFSPSVSFRNSSLADFLGVSSARASQIIAQLTQRGCVAKNEDGSYSFTV